MAENTRDLDEVTMQVEKAVERLSRRVEALATSFDDFRNVVRYEVARINCYNYLDALNQERIQATRGVGQVDYSYFGDEEI